MQETFTWLILSVLLPRVPLWKDAQEARWGTWSRTHFSSRVYLVYAAASAGELRESKLYLSLFHRLRL